MKYISAHIIIVNDNGEFLLTQRNDVPIWVFPGGHIDQNETSVQAIEREINEEIGVEIEKPRHIATYYYNNKQYAKILFTCSMEVDDKNIKINSEVRRVGWFGLKNLPTPMTLHELDKIEDYKRYTNSVIKKEVLIDKKKEILHLMKKPLMFIHVLYSLILNKLTTNTFKILSQPSRT